jgi:hypothetical protein
VNRSDSSFGEKNEVHVYPNPSFGEVLIQANEEVINIQVLNSMGVVLHETHSMNVSLSDYAPGMYFFKIETYRGVYSIGVVRGW